MIGVLPAAHAARRVADALADCAPRFRARAEHGAAARRRRAFCFLERPQASWRFSAINADDPSLNNATVSEPTNLLGGLGATAADLLLQTFGLAALAALAAACRLGRARALRLRRQPRDMARDRMARWAPFSLRRDWGSSQRPSRCPPRRAA